MNYVFENIYNIHFCKILKKMCLHFISIEFTNNFEIGTFRSNIIYLNFVKNKSQYNLKFQDINIKYFILL